MLIKRTYFGNWLRDYSQAVDVGSLKGVNAATIRILVGQLFYLPLRHILTFPRYGFFRSWPLVMPQRSSKSPKNDWVSIALRNTSTTPSAMRMARMRASLISASVAPSKKSRRKSILEPE